MIPIKAIVFAILSLVAMGVSDVLMKIFVRDFTTFSEMISHPKIWLSGLGFASIAFLGLVFWMLAVKFGDVGRLAPIQKMSFIVTVPLAVFLLGEAFNIKMAMAILLAIGAIILLIL